MQISSCKMTGVEILGGIGLQGGPKMVGRTLKACLKDMLLALLLARL